MKLHATITSGYTRKVWTVAHKTGLIGQIQRIATNPHIDEYLRVDNPLCRIPTLILDNGDVLFDSPVICEYLDSLHTGPKLFPDSGPARWNALRLQAIGDGILDTNVARRGDLTRPPHERNLDLIEHRTRNINASYAWLETRISEISTQQLNIGHIAVGCALGWSLVAYPKEAWWETYPKLAQWHQNLEQDPSMAATRYEVLKQVLPSSMIKEGPAATPLPGY